MIDTKSHILNITKSEDKQLDEIINDYFQAGGKGVRLLLALICGSLGKNPNSEDIKHIAAIVEIIHTTTLIHDDIIDKAKERRGRATLNNIYGDNKALFIGDFLFARVLKEVAKIKDRRVHDYLAKTLKELCIGELVQNATLYNVDLRRVDYLKKIKRKTAILIAFACVGGAICSEATEEEIKASYKFGYYLGMSYQIMDDYLDFVADEEQLGKDTGQDLLNGNITLPTIIKISKDREKFLDFENLTLAEKKNLVAEIRADKEIMQETKDISNRYLEKARKEIVDFDNEVQDALLYILDFLSNRKY